MRADSNAQIGTGHLMRCLALAQAWQSAGGRAIFAMAVATLPIEKQLMSQGPEVVHLWVREGSVDDAIQTVEVARNAEATWVIVDGYHFQAEYQRKIKEAGLRLLCIDDFGHAAHYCADMIINPNLHAKEELYSHREPYTQLFLGPRYSLLRREFRKWREWKREVPRLARNILITMGGSDADNVTQSVIQALWQDVTDQLEAIVVVGSHSPHYAALKEASHCSQIPLRLVHQANDMAELMAWADVAISSGGTTCWELAFMSLPSLILVLADNQREVARTLNELEVGVDMGPASQIGPEEVAKILGGLIRDPTVRTKMSRLGRIVVDGKGAERSVDLLKYGPLSVRQDSFRLRPASAEDSVMLWQWTNDSTIRANSFDTAVIPWETHKVWYAKKLASSDTRIWILELRQVPVGQIRYDRINLETAQISFSVTPGYHGKGIGTKLLEVSSASAYRELNARWLQGIAFSSNVASARAFLKAGFHQVEEKMISGRKCLVFKKAFPQECEGESYARRD